MCEYFKEVASLLPDVTFFLLTVFFYENHFLFLSYSFRIG
jgi:hypothetical protein